MFLYWRDVLCLSALCSYWTNRLLIKPNLPEGESFFQGYFSDFLLIPAALPIVLLLLRFVGARRHDLPPTKSEMLTAVVVWTILFEVVGPQITRRATADPFDILAYVVGGLLAYTIWNRRFLLRRIKQYGPTQGTNRN